jgi:YkoY family integral membrane protein
MISLAAIGVAFGVIATLIVMEGLLSADNALVLAIMVKVLPELDRKKALTYGIWGAIGFRALIIGLWAIISHFWWIWIIRVICAAYLGRMTYMHFRHKDDDNNGQEDQYEGKWLRKQLGKIGIKPSLFWSTVISVELTDIAFSTDSISAAFALSSNFWVLFLGGALGIVMMRNVAKIFLKLINAIPEFEGTAYVLIAIIAIKMLLADVNNIVALFGIHMKAIEVNDILFFGVLVVVFLGTFLVHKFRSNETAEVR